MTEDEIVGWHHRLDRHENLLNLPAITSVVQQKQLVNLLIQAPVMQRVLMNTRFTQHFMNCAEFFR